jgi:hypothetical protein
MMRGGVRFARFGRAFFVDLLRCGLNCSGNPLK